MYNTQCNVVSIGLVDRGNGLFHEAEIELNDRSVFHEGENNGFSHDGRARIKLRCDGEKWRIFDLNNEADYERDICLDNACAP